MLTDKNNLLIINSVEVLRQFKIFTVLMNDYTFSIIHKIILKVFEKTGLNKKVGQIR